MAHRLRPALALLALGILTLASWAVATEVPAHPVDLDLVPTETGAEGELPSLESQLAEVSVESPRIALSCPIAKCDRALCPSDCVCRVVNCNEIQCQPLPWDPDSCQ